LFLPLSDAQLHKAAFSVYFAGSTSSQKVANSPSPSLVTHARSLNTSTILYDDKKLESFRAREEQKEAEFNKEPVVSEEKVEEEPEEDEAVTEVRNRILDASLAFVESTGWTRASIVKGAEQAGYPGTVHGMFPRGGIELIDFYYLKCNKELVEEMKVKVAETDGKIEDPKKFVCWAIQQRLAKLEPHLKTWPQALAMMTLPPNVPKSLANMLTLVDDVCYYSGDRSVDVSRR
jgi:ubiquinone biosynthesis protein COQ9